MIYFEAAAGANPATLQWTNLQTTLAGIKGFLRPSKSSAVRVACPSFGQSIRRLT